MAVTTPHPQITEAQWPTYKPFIEKEYLTLNKPAEAVVTQLESLFNVTTSVRRLKIKFDAWKWDKKISAIKYAAMTRVIQHVGQQVVFIVPKMGGRHTCLIDAKKIIKEANRKRTNKGKAGKPPPPTLDLDNAYSILQQSGITFEILRPDAKARLAAIASQLNTNWPTILETLTGDLAGPLREDDYDDGRSEDDDDDDDDHSIASDDSMLDTDMVQETSRELNSQNFPSDLHARHNSSAHGVLPFAAAFLADLHCNVFPSTLEYKLASPSITIAYHHEGNIGLSLDLESLPHDYNDGLGLNHNSELPTSPRTSREKLIEQTLFEHYQRYDNGGHKSMALEFSAYYIAQVLAGQDILDDYNHVDRNDARRKLRVMLETNNMELLTHCYWVSGMMMSYDKIRQLLAFFEDCIDCIETSTSYLGHVLRPWIRLMVLNHHHEFIHHGTQSPRLSANALEQMDRDFDPSRDLSESMNYLTQHGHEGSHTFLILRLYYAWNLCHQEDTTKGLIELLDYLPLAESRFGLEHLVTINCMSMVAKVYEKQANPMIARFYIETALTRLMSCSKMLVSRYYQLQLSLAEFLLAQGELTEAREKLEHILHYRRQHLGVQAPMTWAAAEILFDTMSRQGFGLEAESRRAELKACYDEEWQNWPISNYRRQSS